jgi:hypothetical protein
VRWLHRFEAIPGEEAKEEGRVAMQRNTPNKVGVADDVVTVVVCHGDPCKVFKGRRTQEDLR